MVVYIRRTSLQTEATRRKSRRKYTDLVRKMRVVQAGPAQQDFEWGGSSVSQIFFWGGGGGRGAEACYPGKIRVLFSLRYRKVDLK